MRKSCMYNVDEIYTRNYTLCKWVLREIVWDCNTTCQTKLFRLLFSISRKEFETIIDFWHQSHSVTEIRQRNLSYTQSKPNMLLLELQKNSKSMLAWTHFAKLKEERRLYVLGQWQYGRKIYDWNMNACS